MKSAKRKNRNKKPSSTAPIARRILAFDVGGTGLKAALVGPTGKFLSRRGRLKTPDPRTPDIIVGSLVALAVHFRRYDHVLVGFPGYVRDGKVMTAPHFGTADWEGFALADALVRALRRPVRLVNDADMQGLAAITGKGLELVITLGTGFGSAWFRDGELMPHMEFAHIPIHGKHDFDAYLGDAELKKIGKKKWRTRAEEVIAVLQTVFNYDRLFIGGGNARHLKKSALPANVRTVSNDAGLKGGAWLWHARTGLE